MQRYKYTTTDKDGKSLIQRDALKAPTEVVHGYSTTMAKIGCRKVYIDLPEGKRGFVYERRSSYVPGSEVATEINSKPPRSP